MRRPLLSIALRRWVALFGAMLLAVGVSAQLVSTEERQADDTTGVQKVRIDKARTVRVEKVDTFEYMYLTGDVEISQDSIFMFCDSALVIDFEDVRAFGNVIIQKGDSLKIFADSLKYHSDSMHAELNGEVVLEYNDDQMWTPQLDYDLERDLAYYYRGAVMINDSIQVSSRQGYFNTRSSQARFIDSVVVIGQGRYPARGFTRLQYGIPICRLYRSNIDPSKGSQYLL